MPRIVYWRLGCALPCLLNWYQCFTWKLAQFSRNRSGALLLTRSMSHVPSWSPRWEPNAAPSAQPGFGILVAMFSWPRPAQSRMGCWPRATGPDENQTRALKICQTTPLSPEVYAKQSSLVAMTASFFAKIWMFHKQIYHFCVIATSLRPVHTDAVDLILLSLHVYFSILPSTRLQTRLSLFLTLTSLSLWLPLLFPCLCAVKGQTETGVHCEVIPVKCLLCLCNWCHPAVPIISDWECVQCCFLPALQITRSHQRSSASSWRYSYPEENGSSLESVMNLLLSNNSTDRSWHHKIILQLHSLSADKCSMRLPQELLESCFFIVSAVWYCLGSIVQPGAATDKVAMICVSLI